MAKTQEVADFEDVVERIVFKEGELEGLKIAVRNFGKGAITAKQLKQNLLNSRSRIAKEVSNLLSFIVNRTRSSSQTQDDNNLTSSNQLDLENDQLRQEIEERNELLETVAKRIGALVSKAKNEPNSGSESSGMGLEEAIKIEINRVFSKIKAKEWLDMCGYDNYKFFVKLYPKLEGLYKQRFGESEKSSNSSKDGTDIMANKMLRLGFSEEIETDLVQYITIRNIFQHSMRNISPSNLEQAREAFAKVFVHLIVSNLDSKLVSSNRETFYSFLKGFFSETLKDNPIFREKMLERLKTVFYA